jgi:hypothetical protein
MVARSKLQEDPFPGDNDSIRCLIRVRFNGLPEAITDWACTDEAVLLG